MAQGFAQTFLSIKTYFDTLYASLSHTHEVLGSNGFIIDASSGSSSSYTTLSGVIDNSNIDFVTSAGSYVSGSLKVYLNGQLLTQGNMEDWIEILPESGMFSFNYPPISGDVVMASYKYATVTTGNADTLDGYDSGSFVLERDLSRGILLFDFGTGDVEQTEYVTTSRCTTSSMITVSILGKAVGTNSEDDIRIQPLEVKVSSVGDGVFGITVRSLLAKFVGKVNVSYILMN